MRDGMFGLNYCRSEHPEYTSSDDSVPDDPPLAPLSLPLSFGSSSQAAGGPTILRFMSGDQRPSRRIGAYAPIGKASKSNPDLLIMESCSIKEFLCNLLGYSTTSMWQWLTRTPGVEVTAIYEGTELVAASLGVYCAEIQTYLTHVTGVRRDKQGKGYGTQLRTLQTQSPRVGRVVSLSSAECDLSPHDRGHRSAVQAQARMMMAVGFFHHVVGGRALAEQVIMQFHRAYPTLRLADVMEERDVLPMLFLRIVPVRLKLLPLSGCGSAPAKS